MPKFNVTVRLRVKAENMEEAMKSGHRIVKAGVIDCQSHEPKTYEALKSWTLVGVKRKVRHE